MDRNMIPVIVAAVAMCLAIFALYRETSATRRRVASLEASAKAAQAYAQQVQQAYAAAAMGGGVGETPRQLETSEEAEGLYAIQEEEDDDMIDPPPPPSPTLAAPVPAKKAKK